MPSPVPPSLFKELIPSAGGSVCTKFIRNILRLLPERIYAHVSYERNPDGSIADGFAADIRALACFGGDGGGPGPGPGGTLATPSISATDGTHLDKVVITWAAIVGATSYDVYRNETNTASSASLIGSPSTSSWEDSTVVPGVTYYYWVRAKDATRLSALSASNTGFAATALTAVSDLDATKGFSSAVGISGISLVWTPPASANKYDIYRHTSNSPAAAQLIDTDRVPFDNSMTLDTGPTPTFVDNGGELVYVDQPPDAYDTYYYWVVAKSSSGAFISAKSNVATGWITGDGSGAEWLAGTSVLFSGGSPLTVPANAVRAWIAYFGNGAGGAGGGLLYGGGGGGSGPVIWGRHNVTPGGKYRIVSTPEADTSNAALATSGSAGSTSVLQYASNGVSYSTIASTLAPGGGVYNADGGGLGGAGASGSATGSITGGGTKAGRSGGAASGSAGGRSGYIFGQLRKPPAHFTPGYAGDGAIGGIVAGSGSFGDASGTLVAGGKGVRGIAVIVFYAA